jgi:hypothetical protein
MDRRLVRSSFRSLRLAVALLALAGVSTPAAAIVATKFTDIASSNVVALPNGSVVAAFASPAGIRVFDLGDPSTGAPLEPVEIGSIAASRGFDPASTRVGIIAILIGLVEARVPAISFRDANGVSVYVLEATDGTSNTMMLRRLAPTASFRVEIEGVEAGQVTGFYDILVSSFQDLLISSY